MSRSILRSKIMMTTIVSFVWCCLLLVAGSDAFVPPRTAFVVSPTTITASSSSASLQSSAPCSSRVLHRHNHHHQPQKFSTRNVVLFMGWGPEPIWSDATVLSNSPACTSGRSVRMTVQVSPETAAEYTIPGQYVQVRLDDATKPLFLAIASAPNSENAVFEFLVKKSTGNNNNEWLTSLAPNTQIQVSQVLGNGFAMQENLEGFKYDFPTQNVLLFAAGSGLAPIKAALESGQLQVHAPSSSGSTNAGGRTARLYYGERTEADLCCVELFPQWEQAGFEVVPVLSQPSDSWQGRIGYVQTALEEDGIAIPRNSGALLCGMKGMTEAVKELLTSAGVFEGRVLLNF